MLGNMFKPKSQIVGLNLQDHQASEPAGIPNKKNSLAGSLSKKRNSAMTTFMNPGAGAAGNSKTLLMLKNQIQSKIQDHQNKPYMIYPNNKTK